MPVGKVISLMRPSAILNFAQQFQTFCPLEWSNRRIGKQLHRVESPLQAFGINHLPMDTAIRAKFQIFQNSHRDASTCTQDLLPHRIRVVKAP